MSTTPLKIDTMVVEQTLPNLRLDTFLHHQYPEASRGAIQRLIAEGQIRINGKAVKSNHRPHAGETIVIRWPKPRPAFAQAEDIPLEILFEDSDLLVVNKPPGLVVHPAAGNEEHTLVNALLHHCEGKLSGIGGVMRPGIVHRLDQYTSGCLVVAKNDLAHTALSDQFANRLVKKVYWAILCGELTKETGEIHGAIARHSSHRKRMVVTTKQNARDASTSYQVLEHLKGASLVEAHPHTGRTHQIRVHFQHIGYPLAGDVVYGHSQNLRLVELTGFRAPRQMLHAKKLSFQHPGTGKVASFESPVPQDFLDTVAALKRSA